MQHWRNRARDTCRSHGREWNIEGGLEGGFKRAGERLLRIREWDGVFGAQGMPKACLYRVHVNRSEREGEVCQRMVSGLIGSEHNEDDSGDDSGVVRTSAQYWDKVEQLNGKWSKVQTRVYI